MMAAFCRTVFSGRDAVVRYHLDEIEHHYTARPLAKTVVEMLG